MNSEDLISSDAPLNVDRQSMLRRILRAMIPASDAHQVPGADDPAIVSEILTAGHGQLPLIASALDALLSYVDQNDQAVEPASAAIQDSAIEWFRVQFPEIAGLLVALTVQCYYRDDRVMASLEMDPRPPFPEGYQVRDGDWSLLNPVRARGSIYRKLDG